MRASRFHGGPEKQILEHALRASSEFEIWLGSFRDSCERTEFLQEAEAHALPIIELSSGRFDPRTILELVRVLKNKGFFILCTHGYKANVLGWIASRLSGCQQIAFVRGWTGENWRIKLYERLDRFVLRRCESVVCVSRPLLEEIRNERARRTPPELIPNCAVLPCENLILPSERISLRRTLGVPDRSFCVCAAGRLSVEKGHRHLLNALPGLTGRIPHLLLILLGEGQERATLERQAAELGITRHVRFAGFKKDIRPWIQASDVLVNPSLTEGTPNVVLEAMAIGTPVLATNVGGVPDLIQHLESGVLVPPADSSSLAAAVHSLFIAPGERLRLAQNAQQRLLEYSPERQTKRLNRLYAKVLAVSQRLPLEKPGAVPIHG